ncbi:hypothetical protein ACW9HF_15295 [Nocardia gipuzkoensis]
MEPELRPAPNPEPPLGGTPREGAAQIWAAFLAEWPGNRIQSHDEETRIQG